MISGNSSVDIANCTISNNKGDGVDVPSSSANITNCTIVDNAKGNNNYEIRQNGGPVNVLNSLIWNSNSSKILSGTPTFNYCALPSNITTGTNTVTLAS